MSESSEKEPTIESETAATTPTNLSGENDPNSTPTKASAEESSVESENLNSKAAEHEDSDVIEHNPTGPAGYRENPELAKTLALAAAKVCFDNFSKDVVVLDMSGKTALFDYFVVATGTSRRHLHAISEEIDDVLEKELHDKRMSREGYEESRWIVLDYGSVVVHLFDEETRSYYSLEVLHSDSPKLDLTDMEPKGYRSGTDE